MNGGNVCVEPLQFAEGLRLVRKVCCALTTHDSLTVSGRRPEDLVLLDLSKAVLRRQTTVDRKPFVGVPKVRQVESTEAG